MPPALALAQSALALAALTLVPMALAFPLRANWALAPDKSFTVIGIQFVPRSRSQSQPGLTAESGAAVRRGVQQQGADGLADMESQ